MPPSIHPSIMHTHFLPACDVGIRQMGGGREWGGPVGLFGGWTFDHVTVW